MGLKTLSTLLILKIVNLFQLAQHHTGIDIGQHEFSDGI